MLPEMVKFVSFSLIVDELCMAIYAGCFGVISCSDCVFANSDCCVDQLEG